MLNLKRKSFYLLIITTLIVLSRARSESIIFLNDNFTEENNATESLTNNSLLHFPNIFSSDTFNNTQGNIIKAIVGFDKFIFDVARNITSGMRFVQFFILNKTKTFIMPFIMFSDEKSFENFKNYTLNNTEFDSSSKSGNYLPINLNMLDLDNNGFRNSTYENGFIKPELFTSYLRGGNKTIRYNEKNYETTNNFTDANPRNESEKVINSTLVRLNKFVLSSRNNENKSDNYTNKPRFLQFTSLFGMGGLDSQYMDLGFIDTNAISDVGNVPFLIDGANIWVPEQNEYDGVLNNGFGLDYEYN